MSKSQDQIRIEPDLQTAQYQGNDSYHTDADGIRRHFGIPPYGRDAFAYPAVYPNFVEHCYEGPEEGATKAKGGTDFLCTRKPGAGKSTFGLHVATRMLEVNNEVVVWRGSPSRSEWLPLAPWATVCLPKGVDIQARLEPRDPRLSAVDVEIEDMCREVRHYENPVHLNREILEPGKFHVVYPDPQMRGCQEWFEDAPEKANSYDTGDDRRMFERDDPLIHWWFAWAVLRVEFGPHNFTTLIFDEVGDWVPESAPKGEYITRTKIDLLTDAWVDFRKYGLTCCMFGHSDVDVHNKIRHKVRWRVQLPGAANPTAKGDLVGFESVPMDTDLTSNLPVGEALMFTESHFDWIGWPNYTSPIDRKLKINMVV
ncbi:MAG: ATP-binding protein [Halorientalis sp.]